jgi:type IV pilus assembly protein PilY1
LGDIVDSTPVYVGAPQSAWPEYSTNSKFGTATKSYSAYKTAQVSRTPVVYVGANDGMLHGFNAQFGTSNTNRGKELIAYVPRAVASDLKDSGIHYFPALTYSHKFYVDLTPTIADVFMSADNVVANRDWHTVLVGGLRQGGKGYFALDITNPSNFTEANAASLALWEFTDANDSDVGYSYSEPTIAMMNNGKWAVIFGNGYNSINGIAKLFILYLEQGADGTWSAGDYVKIDTKSGGTPLATGGNGLSSPQAADLDGNGTVDRIYAGDLKGQMWAFDVSAATDTSWAVAYGTAAAPAPLFTAKDASNNAQPITTRPLLAKNLDNVGGASPNIVVMFGTGEYVTQADITDINRQTFYVVGDMGTGSLLRANLLQRTFTTSGTLRSPTTGQAALVWSTKSGWYMDLNIGTTTPALSAERVVTQASLRRRTLFFNTMIPDGSPCTGGGTGWLMSFDFLTGLNPSQAVFDSNADGVINSSDMPYVGQYVSDGLPTKSGILGSKQYTPTSSGSLSIREINVGSSTLEGRLGWEELRPK